MRHDEADEPDQPAIATAAAVASEASPSRIPRSRATSTPRWAAVSSPSSRPLSAGPAADQRRSRRDDRQRPGERGHVAASKLPSRYAKIWRRLGARQVHRHRQPGGQQRPDRVPGEEQARQRGRPPCGTACRPQTASSAPRNAKPGAARARGSRPDRDEHRDRRAEGGSGRGTQHVGVSQRVAQQALERGSGDRQRQPDEHRREDARQAQLHHDRLRGGAVLATEVDAEEALREDRDRVGRLDRHGPETDAEHQRNRQGCEPASRQQERPPADARRRPRARCVCVIDSPRVVTTVRRRGPGKRRTPQLGGRARGPRRWCASVCLPFLSKVRASNHGIGDRTCALEGRPP